MTLVELKRELRRVLRAAGVKGYRYAALVVHGRDDGPDEVVVVAGRAKVRTPARRGRRGKVGR